MPGDLRAALRWCGALFSAGVALGLVFCAGYLMGQAKCPGTVRACESALMQCLERVGVYERFKIGETLEGEK